MPPRKKKGGRGGWGRGRSKKSAPTIQSHLSHHLSLLHSTPLPLPPLKPDHTSRPLYVLSTGMIVMEVDNPLYATAYDFLVTISEPVARPQWVHHYQTPIPHNVSSFIKGCTERYGKVKLVLKDGKVMVEGKDDAEGREILRFLSRRPEILECRVKSAGAEESEGGEGWIKSTVEAEDRSNLRDVENEGDTSGDDESEEEEGEDEVGNKIVKETKREGTISFEIESTMVENVKKTCIELDYPLMEEYDFRSDSSLKSIPNFNLRPSTRIRRYQERSLSKMFGNGRARSGIIVLPCGAGKTLTGVTAAQTVGKGCIVLCTNAVSVLQWKEQFQKWTTIGEREEDKGRIACFTSQMKDQMHPEGCVLITTYTMLTFSGKRNEASEEVMKEIQGREWGLIMMDEVHVVPAATFRKVIGNVKSHTKLGLTATLVREDDKIGDLNFLIGPKLYEANWMDLTAAGYLANVQCLEVWCPLPRSFMKEYLKMEDVRRKQMLYVMNPCKMRTVEFLLKEHKKRGDKIIVFSDLVTALVYYSKKFQEPCIHGGTAELERQGILGMFKANQGSSTLFISKVGDTSIDLPEANVIIQIASHYGSRRQEAQRLGRILRPKAGTATDGTNKDSFNAFFYTLVSTDTSEMYYSTKRQQYLVDQGYTFRILTNLHEKATARSKAEGGLCSTVKEENAILRDILAYSATGDEHLKREEAALEKEKDHNLQIGSVKRQGGLGEKSGGRGKLYQEIGNPRNDFFKSRKIKTKHAQLGL
ncbi:hypothetical protein TrRE_jg2984 [Triparma retinervis]|uniref:DNA 3'-5' helicase n=1 Tax=Triparma retinervis TaxID=2557542 RepID=A0A9W7E7K5_9STRA|nr:hypothetical protein TrRE_jg2984 [Triparma retinervis]